MPFWCSVAQLASSQNCGAVPPPPSDRPMRVPPAEVARAHHQVALEQAVARVALEERGIADAVAERLLEVVDHVAAHDPAPSADHVDHGHRIGGVAGPGAVEAVALDQHVVGEHVAAARPDWLAVALDRGIEVAHAVVAQHRAVRRRQQVEGVLAEVIAAALALDRQVLEAPVGRGDAEALDGVEAQQRGLRGGGAQADRRARRAAATDVQIALDQVAARGEHDLVAGIGRRERRLQARHIRHRADHRARRRTGGERHQQQHAGAAVRQPGPSKPLA